MDDELLWEEALVTGWGPHVRAAVVARVERATVGRRGILIRAVADPDNARYAWTEELHGVVLRAIEAETGADLESLGSQAAWAVYDETWSALAHRWADGGDLRSVPEPDRATVLSLVRDLPPGVAAMLGADTGVDPYGLLELSGALRIDLDGAHLAVAADLPGVDAVRDRLNQLLALLS